MNVTWIPFFFGFWFFGRGPRPRPKPSKPRIVASEWRIRDVADPADDFVFTATMSTPLSFRAPMASVASVGHRAGADAPVSRAARAGPSHFVDRRRGAGVRCTAAGGVVATQRWNPANGEVTLLIGHRAFDLPGLKKLSNKYRKKWKKVGHSVRCI